MSIAETGEDVVEWHTWSGRKHKFGPLVSTTSRYREAYRVARCNGSIVTTGRTQERIAHTSICKRCFPAVQS